MAEISQDGSVQKKRSKKAISTKIDMTPDGTRLLYQ
jgi:hypothetical protein